MSENNTGGSDHPGTVGQVGRVPSWVTAWARDGVLLTLSQVALLGVTTALAVLVARELGPDDFGIFSAFLSLSIVVALYTEAGLSTWLLRELSAEVEQTGGSLSVEARTSLLAACGLNLVLGAIALTVALPLGFAFGSGGGLVAALGGLMIYTTAISLATALEAVFRANRMVRRVIAASVVEKVILVVMVLLALHEDWGILGVALSYTSAGLVRCAFDAVIVFGRALKPQIPTWSEIGSVVRRSLPLALGSNAATAIVRLDTFLIGLLSVSAAGYYAIGDRVCTAMLLIASTAAVAFFPIVAKHRDAAHASVRGAALLGALGIALVVPLILISPTVIPALFGDSYSSAVPAVQIMLIGVPLTYASSILMVGAFSLGREHDVIITLIPTLIVGTLLVVTGQLIVGVQGAAAGYALRFALALVALSLVTRRASRALGSDRSDRTAREPVLDGPSDGPRQTALGRLLAGRR